MLEELSACFDFYDALRLNTEKKGNNAFIKGAHVW